MLNRKNLRLNIQSSKPQTSHTTTTTTIIIIIITIITDLKEDPVNPKTQTLTSPQKRKSLDFFRKQADGIALGAGGERVRAENKGRLKISFVTCLAGLLHESAR